MPTNYRDNKTISLYGPVELDEYYEKMARQQNRTKNSLIIEVLQAVRQQRILENYGLSQFLKENFEAA